MQRARLRGHCLGLGLQTGDHRGQAGLIHLEHTKETADEALEPFGVFRLARLESVTRHDGDNGLKCRAKLEVRGEGVWRRKAEASREVVGERDGHFGFGVGVFVDLGLLCVQSLRGGPVRVRLDAQSGANGQHFEEKGKTGTCMRILCRITLSKELLLVKAE